MDVPPSRYKVVEQGRRLVVIDTWNGDAPVTGHAPRGDAAARPATVEQARAALRPARPRPGVPQRPGPQRTGDAGMGVPDTVIATQSWFDARGPRTLKLDASAQGLLLVVALVVGIAVIVGLFLFGWPLLLVLGFALAQPRVRAGLRAGIAAWLDMYEAG